MLGQYNHYRLYCPTPFIKFYSMIILLITNYLEIVGG